MACSLCDDADSNNSDFVTKPHPIAPSDKISRQGNPSLGFREGIPDLLSKVFLRFQISRVPLKLMALAQA